MYSRFIAVLCLFVCLVAALPQPDLAVRQAASLTASAVLSSPTSITTTSTVQTPNGAMTETCQLTLTPNGQQINESRSCTMSPQTSSTSISTSPTAAAAFVLPGTTIQVLPIGLGVFGGITAIAVFFVAYVTWERVQYRKTFRLQRMAESNLMRGMAKV